MCVSKCATLFFFIVFKHYMANYSQLVKQQECSKVDLLLVVLGHPD